MQLVRMTIASLVAGLLLLKGAVAESPQVPALTVSVTKPLERDWPETVPASGWLKPWHEAIIASEIGGLRITEVLVDVGSVVKKGQALARLAQESVLADLRKQQAAVKTAQSKLEKAKSDADRARQLRGSGALSAQNVTELLTAEDTASATLDSERAALESQQIRLNQTTVVAVDDGLITSRSADLGAVVASGTELFRLIRQQRVEWQAEVSARYLPRISEGLAATIIGPERLPIQGTVRLVGPLVSSNTGRALVYIALPTDARLRVGLYLSGNIELRTTSALTIPETALVFRDGINYVFIADEASKVRRARVEAGRRNGGEVEIVSGIDRSSMIVVSGGAFLSDNDVVRIVEKR